MRQIINNIELEVQKWRTDPIKLAIENEIHQQVILHDPGKGYKNSRFILEQKIKRASELLTNYLHKTYPNLYYQINLTECSSL